MNVRPLVCVLSLLTVAVAFCQGEQVQAKSRREYVKVPVLFITDRQAQKAGYGPYRVTEKETVSRIDSGTAEVTIPIEAEPPAEWQHLDWMERVRAPEKPALTKFPGDTAEDLNGGFDTGLNQLMNRYQKKEVFLFVHGFNNSFPAALTKAAELSYATGCPVILYSWPSAGKVSRYLTDEGNNEWSQEHYNQLMEHLLHLQASAGISFNLVAHSLGNRLFARSGPLIGGKGLFSDLYLVYPDIDAQTFVHYLARCIPPSGPAAGVRCRLLISRKDKALAFSERMFGGYTRLGQGVDFSLTAFTRPHLFRNVWELRQPAQSTQEKTAIAPDKLEKIEKAFRILDVTAADRGLIGHKIPYDVIAWMHYRNTAQPGFEFQETQCKGLNRLASFFARRSKQKVDPLLGKIFLLVKSSSLAKVAR